MDMNLHIPVSNFEFIDDNDDHFLKVRLQAIANGENLNRSDFDKDGMDISKDSFRGKPLLCAFPKNKYANEYKIGDGHNSSGILYDSEYGEFYHSYLDANSERMVGYIPSDSNISIELIEDKYWICMDAVILRKYNYELVKDILNKKNGKSKRDNKRISVEIEVLESHMRKHDTENYDVEVIDKFKGMGVTILFDDTQEAVVGANLKAFSESEQYNKFKSFMQYNFENKEFIDKDDIGTGEKITIKKDKVSDTPWGDVNKSELYKKALNASNYKAVVRFIYAKVEAGWEDNPSEKLKYPIGQIIGKEAVYNKGGLASALGYSKAEGDDTITNKVERIRKQLGLNEDSEKYAVEKNTDILDNKEIIVEYPDKLEMTNEKPEEQNFELTVNQKKEILSIALSELCDCDEDDDMDEHNHDGRRYWICDLDDTYIYVQDYENDYRTYRIKYTLNQDSKTAEIYLETKEEVICSGYETVGQEGENSVKEEFKTDETLAKEKEEMEAKEKESEKKMEENPDEKQMEEQPDEEKMAEDKPAEEKMEEEKPAEEKMEEKPSEETMAEVELEAENTPSDKDVEACHAANGTFVCKAGEYVIYSVEDKLYASKSDNFEEKFEVALDMRFDVQTTKVGGVEMNDVQTIAPMKVSFESGFNKMSRDTVELATKAAEFEAKATELQAKLDTYKCKELSNKFDEIAFDANITVAEKADWKSRINKNEFACEDELVEKFGGFVFKKSIENKYSAYTSEAITEKVNNKKSYEELIDQYMTDK